MSRSIKKGPYVDKKIIKKVQRNNVSGVKKVIRVHNRACTIVPEFVGQNFAIYNGRRYIPIYITEDMVGHKLGEFSPTRTYKGHTSKKTA